MDERVQGSRDELPFIPELGDQTCPKLDSIHYSYLFDVAPRLPVPADPIPLLWGANDEVSRQ